MVGGGGFSTAEVEADNIITAVEDMAQDMVQDMAMVVEAEVIMEESE